MAALGPFEARPRLAVAVSGGADSLCLTLLADIWCRERGGEVLGLTVDHRLRPTSADEAGRVRDWLGGWGISHQILRDSSGGPLPRNQAEARDLRYRLLTAAVVRAGLLHLSVAHHSDDQVETVLLRLAKRSGMEGLAGMAAIVEAPGYRLLRPLLGVPRRRLVATLVAQRQDWLEDPSNRDPRFGRSRIRAAMAGKGTGTADRVARVTELLGRRRFQRDVVTDAALGRYASIYSTGHAVLAVGALCVEAPHRVSKVISRVVTAVGGGGYPPRRDRLSRICAWLAEGSDGRATLARCRLERDGGGLLICREQRGLPRMRIGPGEGVLWDGRFQVWLPMVAPGGEWMVEPLGTDGWREIVRSAPILRASKVPWPVRIGLPALRSGGDVAAVPALDFLHPAASRTLRDLNWPFQPRNPLSTAGFAVALKPCDIM